MRMMTTTIKKNAGVWGQYTPKHHFCTTFSVLYTQSNTTLNTLFSTVNYLVDSFANVFGFLFGVAAFVFPILRMA